jgi:glycosyltransferase involved in cell wall biosynthesis
MNDAARPRCAVITCFAPQQPGFLDFSYRVQALTSEYEVTLVSNLDLAISEFDSPNLHKVKLQMPGGQLGWLAYLLKCFKWLHDKRFDLVVLLHSTTAPLALGRPFYKAITATYWNEHPTHHAPPCGRKQPLKATFRFALRQLMFWGAKRSDLVMPIGEAHRDDLIEHGCKPARVQMLYMGVSETFRTPSPKKPPGEGSPLQLIYIGSVQADRGRDVMLEAMAIIAKDPEFRTKAHLTIVGAQPEQIAFCASRLNELAAQDHVTILGRIPGGDIPNHLAHAHVGLCLWEDQIWYRYNPPTKLFEYLVAGLPVMASRIRTHTTYIEEGKNGFIFEYSAEGLATCIKDALRTQRDWTALNRHTWDSGQPYLWPKIKGEFLDALRPVARRLQ